jgi:hypothetical protein
VATGVELDWQVLLLVEKLVADVTDVSIPINTIHAAIRPINFVGNIGVRRRTVVRVVFGVSICTPSTHTTIIHHCCTIATIPSTSTIGTTASASGSCQQWR